MPLQWQLNFNMKKEFIVSFGEDMYRKADIVVENKIMVS
jgi:hypothetical protein